MTTARQRFLANLLESKGGVYNRIASRYIRAGYRVRFDHGFKDIDLVISRSRESYGLKILYMKKIYVKTDLENFFNNCEKHGLKPVIILYGSGPRLDQETLASLAEKKVKIRRVRC